MHALESAADSITRPVRSTARRHRTRAWTTSGVVALPRRQRVRLGRQTFAPRSTRSHDGTDDRRDAVLSGAAGRRSVAATTARGRRCAARRRPAGRPIRFHARAADRRSRRARGFKLRRRRQRLGDRDVLRYATGGAAAVRRAALTLDAGRSRAADRANRRARAPASRSSSRSCASSSASGAGRKRLRASGWPRSPSASRARRSFRSTSTRTSTPALRPRHVLHGAQADRSRETPARSRRRAPSRLLGVLAVFRRGGRRASRWAAVVTIARSSPASVRSCCAIWRAAYTRRCAASTRSLWLIWEVPLFLAAVSVLLLGRRRGRQRAGPAARCAALARAPHRASPRRCSRPSSGRRPADGLGGSSDSWIVAIGCSR